MTKLDSSMERFFQALDKLESAAERRKGDNVSAEQAQRELVALKEDRARLVSELEKAKIHNQALEDVTDEVSERLDGAITEIQGALEG